METALSTLGELFVDATASKVKAVTPNGAKARREIGASGAIFLVVSENEGKLRSKSFWRAAGSGCNVSEPQRGSHA